MDRRGFLVTSLARALAGPLLAEARRIIREFIACCNSEWLIERLGHQSPVAARLAAMAA